MTTLIDYNDNFKPNSYFEGEESCGTTIMAITFDGGVVCAADSRTSRGSYVSNRFANKLTPVTDNIICLRSGSSADTQCIADVVSYYLSVYEMETEEPVLVHVAANSFANMIYKYRDQMKAGILVAGWDKHHGGQVYTVSLGGMLVKQPISIGGSGNTYVHGFVDSNYREKMSKDECIKFAINAVALAMSKDGSSGGIIRLKIITKDGIENRVILGNELPKYYEG